MPCQCEGIASECGIPCSFVYHTSIFTPCSCGCMDCINSPEHHCHLCKRPIWRDGYPEKTCSCFLREPAPTQNVDEIPINPSGSEYQICRSCQVTFVYSFLVPEFCPFCLTCNGVIQEINSTCNGVIQEINSTCNGVIQEINSTCNGVIQEINSTCNGVIQEINSTCNGVIQEINSTCNGVIQGRNSTCNGVIQERNSTCNGMIQERNSTCNGVIQERNSTCNEVIQERNSTCNGVIKERNSFRSGVIQERNSFCNGVIQERNSICNADNSDTSSSSIPVVSGTFINLSPEEQVEEQGAELRLGILNYLETNVREHKEDFIKDWLVQTKKCAFDNF